MPIRKKENYKKASEREGTIDETLLVVELKFKITKQRERRRVEKRNLLHITFFLHLFSCS